MRYSLRCLMLLVTLLAVLLSIWTNRALDQRETIARIRALGGDVQYAAVRLPYVETWLSKDFVSSVVEVQMYRWGPDVRYNLVVDDANFIECVRRLPTVKRIEGLKGNHQEMAERIQSALPHVEVRLFYGGVI